MEISLVFFVAGAVIILGFLGEWIFQKTNIPDPIWLMMFGFLLNQAYSLSSNPVITDTTQIFAIFAMIFLLFEGVMNTNLKTIVTGFVRGSGLAFLSFFLAVIMTTAVMKAFGWGWIESIILGIILGDSAQTVIIPLGQKIGLGKDSFSALTFESAFSDVLCIVGTITLINISLLGEVSVREVTKSILYSFTVALFIGIAAGMIWVLIHKKMDKFNKSYITTIAALMILYAFVEYFGGSGAMACLTFGIIIANSREIFSLFNSQEEDPGQTEKFFYAEISFFVKSFFFVYLGMMITFRDYTLIWIGLLLVMLIYIARPVAVKLSGLASKLGEKERVFVEVLNPKGTSAAVLATIPLQYGVAHGFDIAMIIPSVITFSIIVCVILVMLTSNGYFKGFGWIFSSAFRIITGRKD